MNLKLEEQRVWKHELKGKHPILFVLFLFCFGFGFGGCHCQLLTKVSSPFFSFCFVVFGSKWVPSPTQAPSFSFFFLCVLLLVGANGLHH